VFVCVHACEIEMRQFRHRSGGGRFGRELGRRGARKNKGAGMSLYILLKNITCRVLFTPCST